MEKLCIARQATDANIMRRMRFACWIPKATNTLSEYVIVSLFHYNNGYANASEYTLPVLCCLCLMVYITPLSAPQTVYCRIIVSLSNNLWERIGKGSLIALFEVLSSIWLK